MGIFELYAGKTGDKNRTIPITNRLLYHWATSASIDKKGVAGCFAAPGFHPPPSNCHQKNFSTFAIASCKFVESTMLYRSNVDSVRWPQIFMAILHGTP